eukprot:m.145689 g.145689  ORF g.145689 m.145689 type:complete len:281 (-) comp24284_c1_seq6:481-1323(-)
MDMSKNVDKDIGGDPNTNGTYNRYIFTDRAIDLIKTHNFSDGSLYIYLAYQNVHLACGFGNPLGIQAPCETVDLYPKQANDTYKLAGAFLTELDYGVGNVTQTLKDEGLFDDSVVIFQSDNGGPLHHSNNYPYRGGKWTFWEGGVRLASFVSSPMLPKERQGKVYYGMAHSADWYKTIVEGIVGGKLPNNTGPNPPDSFNLWPAILSNGSSPRNEVVSQVSNQWFSSGSAAVNSVLLFVILFDVHFVILQNLNMGGNPPPPPPPPKPNLQMHRCQQHATG